MNLKFSGSDTTNSPAYASDDLAMSGQPNNQVSTQVIDPDQKAIENFIPSIAKLPAVLQQHNVRVTTAEAIAAELLKEFEIEGKGIMTADWDEAFKAFIIRARTAVEEMEAARKPGTQSFDLIRGYFTKLEKKLDPKNPDSVVNKFQSLRNRFADEEAKRIEAQRREADRIANIEKEKISIESRIKEQIGSSLINYQSRRKSIISDEFNKITLENFSVKSEGLRAMDCNFPTAKLGEIIEVALPPLVYHTKEEVTALFNSICKSYDFQTFKIQYHDDLQNLKTSLITQLPAKKKQLEDIAAADKAEAELLVQRQQERERLQQEELQRQQQQQLQQHQNQVKQQEQSGHLNTLFTTASSVQPSAAIDAKHDVTLTVNNVAGFIEVINLWCIECLPKLTLADAQKKSVNAMIGDLEKIAKAGGTRIAGSNVTYGTKTTAVNRRSKA